MNFTKEQVQGFPEAELRRNVLIPLFNAMGFHDVFEYHGGTQEQGKDIVMWKPGEFRDRTNFAVVVKATKITGQASGKSSANEVAFQIQQAFGSPFLDPTTGESRQVHECIVVSSKDISKEAIQSIRSALVATHREDRVAFHNGDKLWENVEKHFPASAALNRVREIQRHFDAIDPDYRVIPHFFVEPKLSSSGEAPPANPRISLKFPDNAAGKEKVNEINKHIKTGAPVYIPQEFIPIKQLPKVFQAMLGERTKIELEIPARADDRSRFVKIEVTADDGSAGELNFIELRTTQAGTDEVTLSNSKQEVPWKITLVMNRVEISAHCRFNITYEGNAHQVLDAFRFQRVISKPASVRVIDLGTGFELMRFRLGTESNPCPPGIDDVAFELAEKLALIQSKAEVLIPWRAGKIGAETVMHIFEVAEIVQNGKLVHEIESLTMRGERGVAEKVLAMSGQVGVLKTVSQEDHIVEVFGQRVSLGRVMTICHGVYVANPDLENLKLQMEDASRGTFDFVLTAKDGALHERYYPKWLPKAEAEVIQHHMKLP